MTTTKKSRIPVKKALAAALLVLLAAALACLVDYVVAELGQHHAGDIALLHLEGSLVELRHHHAATEPAEGAALRP